MSAPTTKTPVKVDSVYLSGPMTGLPEFNYPAFHRASAAIRSGGVTVWNPAEYGDIDTTGLTGNERDVPGFELRPAFAEYCRVIALEVDAVAVLPGWENSRGARAEVALAQAVGKPILDAFTLEQLHPEIAVVSVASEPAAPTTFPGFTEAVPVSGKDHAGMVGTMTDPHRLTDEATAEPADQIAQRDATDAGRIQAPAPVQLGKGEVRTTSSTGGQKGTKEARFALIPPGPLWELAVLYGRGAEKYAADNWKRGYSWSLSYDALVRHLNLWWTRQEDHDPEMGVKHLINVAWHAFNLAWFMENRPEFDDRPQGPQAPDGTYPGEKYDGALPTPQWILDKQNGTAA